MSDVATPETMDVTESGHDEGEHHDAPYFLIWFVLLVLTLAEVGYALVFTEFPKWILATGLILMAIWKALLVALYYMHLRWEPKKLWILAVSPLPLILIFLLAVMTEY